MRSAQVGAASGSRKRGKGKMISVDEMEREVPRDGCRPMTQDARWMKELEADEARGVGKNWKGEGGGGEREIRSERKEAGTVEC
ncbi:hypothetical protein POX_a00373 [Penicillium oxalicum]|uniref:Uncharacterized protein n=1 Tax=Penicillium oxalicum (strain 114-2 / CGMCC 5302) TaxID=933388 RepID=S7ZV82_PENO1|nr:hypothetical protein POX_a00373 [Penicillium oxalicum]EPS34655.1 hypothetical protein PDE_09619 [Penicillium oxalicum 114-2]KAI2793787.1 hypothetical protein POX_a00373 [Penicillium oxalicum]